jgi:retron-type reverse transcriptase
VAQAQQYIAEGRGWCVDLDLERFFDRVNHDKLMGHPATDSDQKESERIQESRHLADLLSSSLQGDQAQD